MLFSLVFYKKITTSIGLILNIYRLHPLSRYYIVQFTHLNVLNIKFEILKHEFRLKLTGCQGYFISGGGGGVYDSQVREEGGLFREVFVPSVKKSIPVK